MTNINTKTLKFTSQRKKYDGILIMEYRNLYIKFGSCKKFGYNFLTVCVYFF